MQTHDPDAPATRTRTFEVGPLLGKGGFGEVYHAIMDRPGGLRTEVALKVLHHDLSPQSQAVERLRDEGRVLGLLRHPAIVRVLDLIILEERVALVSEYIEGVDLHAVRGEIDPRAAVEIIGIVADALAVAFTQQGLDGRPLGLVHRDVKPANIRLGRHGEVKLLDFGIAKAQLEERDASTSTGLLLGSMPYMSPERMAGDPVGPPADVFALGATLWECLVGRRLMGQLTVPDQVRLALDEDAYDAFITQSLAELTAPPAVTRLVADMLARDPCDRPSAQEVADRCDGLVAELEGQALRAWARGWSWPSRSIVEGPLSGRTLSDEAAGDSTSGMLAAPWPASDEDQDEEQDSDDGGRGSVLLYVAAGLTAVLLIGIACSGLGGAVALQQLVLARPATVATPPVVAPLEATDPPASELMDTEAPDAETDDSDAPAVAEVAPSTPPVVPTVVVDRTPPQVRPDPEPAPDGTQPTSPDTVAPPPESGTIAVRGRLIPEIRRDGRTFPAGQVAAGTYTLWYDFGEGLKPAGTVEVRPGDRVTVQCNALRYDCSRR